MKLNLKQDEITAAITMYLAEQGIRVHNKTIDMAFTAGRKGSGLSVEVNIEDAPCLGAINQCTTEEVEAFNQMPVVVISEVAQAQVAQEPEFLGKVVEEVGLSTNPVGNPEQVKTTSLFS